jgi:hypothetical protein
MRQSAPDPAPLYRLLDSLIYEPPGRDWDLSLRDLDRGQGSAGLTLVICVTGPDTYHPERTISVNHYFIVPAAAYNEQSWRRWLFDQIGLVELHERMEFFRLRAADGTESRPLAPNHGPGWDPYLVTELATDADRRTSFRGELNPA